jgi:hypothetical protein
MDFKLCHNGKFTSINSYKTMAESWYVITGDSLPAVAGLTDRIIDGIW